MIAPPSSADPPSTLQSFSDHLGRTAADLSSTLCLLERGTGYYAVSENALVIATALFNTHSPLSYLKHSNTPVLFFTKPKFKELVNAFLITQSIWKLVIYTTTPPNSFCIARSASPGNLVMVQDIIDLPYDSPNLMALAIRPHASPEHFLVALAVMNTAANKVSTYQYLDIDLLTTLESVLIQFHIKECVFSVPASLPAIESRLLSILTQLDIAASPSTTFHSLPDLAPFFNTKLDPTDLVRTCISTLIHTFHIPADRGLTHSCLNISGILRLDHHALSALGIFPDTTTTNNNNQYYLFGHINHHVSTVLGTRTLTHWLRQPLTDIQSISSRHLLVEHLTRDNACRDYIRTWLRNVPDITKLVRKLDSKRGALSDAVTLFHLAQRVPDLQFQISQSHLNSYFGLPLAEIQPYFDQLSALVTENVDLDSADQYSGTEYRIKPGVNENLVDLDQQISRLNMSVKEIGLSVSETLGLDLYKVVKLEYSNHHGHHLRVSVLNAHSLNRINKTKNYIELTTLKSGVLFTTTELRRVSLQLVDLNAQYADIQNDLVLQLLSDFAEALPAYTLLAETVAELDVLAAFALVGLQAPVPYVRPQLVSNRELYLPNLRHPTIEVQPGMLFIPNTVDLCEGRAEMAIITGPNMGGKSTYARSAALSIILSQIGCFVPADAGARMCVFDAIQCRIGASDNLAKGVSTFMQEMLEVAGILRGATDRSFIILDELGRGTSTSDGFGLAWAICDHIATHLRPFCIVATHFHELTELKCMSRIVNLHVTAGGGDAEDVTMLYKVEHGATSKSFGIQVAKRAGFPGSVIASARYKLGVLERQTPDSMRAGKDLVAQFLGRARALDRSDPVAYKRDLCALKSEFEMHVGQCLVLKRFLDESVRGDV